MKRLTVIIAGVAALVAAGTSAAGSTPPGPSCVGSITRAEAQSAPGAIGAEVSGLAKDAHPLGALVDELANQHGSC